MRNFGLWLFILALPVLAVVGHDLYIAYQTDHGFDFSKPFAFSDFGWIWQRRAFGSWKWAHERIDPHSWNRFVVPVLNQKAIIVAAAPLALYLVFLTVCKLIGVGPFASNGLLSGRSTKIRSSSKKSASGEPKVTYKRR